MKHMDNMSKHIDKLHRNHVFFIFHQKNKKNIEKKKWKKKRSVKLMKHMDNMLKHIDKFK